MLAVMSLALIQAASSTPLPVVKDPPPSMLLAGYDQCLGREVTRLLNEPVTPEEVFDRGQAECGFWLDAYFIKRTSQIVATNIDFQQEKSRFVAKVRDQIIDYVRTKRRTLEARPATPEK